MNILRNKKNIIEFYMYIVVLILFIILVMVYYLDAFNRNFSVFVGGGDSNQLLAYVKSIKENGLWGQFFVHRIGAPEDTAVWIDSPVVDTFHVFIIWVCTKFFSTIGTVIYVDYIITYILAAICMFLLLRNLRIKYCYCLIFSIIFSFAPSHFIRGVSHITVSQIFSIPLGIIVALYIMEYERKRSKKEILGLIFITILVGIGYQYYAFFMVISWFPAYLVYFIKCWSKECRDWKIYVKKFWVFLLCCGSLFITRLPAVIYLLKYGSNEQGLIRSAAESEIYGLKIIQLFVPSPFTQSLFLQKIRNIYNDTAFNINENSAASLGIIASIGLIIAMFWFFILFVKRDRDFLQIDYLPMTCIFMILICITGGIGTIFNYIVSPQLRCYNRGSMVIACLSLTFLAMLIDQINIKQKKLSILFHISLCSLLLGVVFYDQIPDKSVQSQSEIQNDITYKDFFGKIEDTMTLNAQIYQLPWMDYPENGSIQNMNDYEHFKGYIYTDDLKWSYGGVKGRNEMAKALYIDEGKSYKFIYGIKKAGFSGVYIDTTGFEDGGEEILEFYNSLGIEAIISRDGTLYFYDISEIDVNSIKFYITYSFVEKIVQLTKSNINLGEINKIAINFIVEPKLAIDDIYSMLENGTNKIADYNNREYVNWLYVNILDRNGDDTEINNWVNYIENTGEKKKVLYEFITSTEFYVNLGIPVARNE